MPDDDKKKEGATATAEAPATPKADTPKPGVPATPEKKPATSEATPSQPAAKKEGDEKKQPQTKEAGAAPEGDNLPKGVKITLHKLREKNRESEAATKTLQEQFDAQKKRIEELETAAKAAPVSTDAPDPLEDPKKYADWVAQRSVNAIEARENQARQSREQEAREAKLYQESQAAEKWLGTLGHLKDSVFASDLQSRLDADKELQEIASVSPMRAARLAYLDVCEAKGVAPELGKSAEKAASEASRGNGVQPSTSTPAGGGPKVWKRGEVTAYLDKFTPGTAEHKEALSEVKKARSEGRVEA